MLVIAKTKRRDEHVIPTGMAIPSHQEKKTQEEHKK